MLVESRCLGIWLLPGIRYILAEVLDDGVLTAACLHEDSQSTQLMRQYMICTLNRKSAWEAKDFEI